ncbi:ATP synthase F1 subunit delta [Flavipsychrobacter stenotrophus]|uniref:ATP synthase subunit delta n=1 Tax=Flavipsychrobacter stenotrophus TaxID=2077091 RepID=A0A2S7SXW2_9BACT|nr:ATP synthase F1 subunit delta [Flavipsychrobacter stenotrophus]PQJ11457.1 ATP synthase F1 subunit delta [Flavipsychrobacter stenotrophus]
MQNPRLASRYAKSLLDLAIETNKLEDTLKDIQLLDNVCRVSPEFTVMLRSPVIRGDKKLAVINAVVKDSLHELTKKFIALLGVKGRESNMPEIVTVFIEQYNKLKNIRTVNLTTATAMDDKMKNAMLAKIAGFMPTDTVDMKTKIDASLIGGFVLEIEGKLFDASVKKKLNDIKSSIVDNSYVSKM